MSRRPGQVRDPSPRGRGARRLLARLLLGSLALAAAPLTLAQSGAFSAAFDAALANDAEYRASRYELRSREQVVPIARAGLLPSIGASYAESRVRGDRESLNALGQEFGERLDYRSPVLALQLRQPLLNLEAMRRYDSAVSQADSARSVFVARGHELLDRLGAAYVLRLFAEELVGLAQAQVDAYQVASDAAARRFAGGEGTRTEVAEAAASLSLARAQLVEATDDRDIAQRSLERITGTPGPALRALAEDTRPLPLTYASASEWIDVAMAGNPNIQSRRYLVDAARHEVERNRAGHFPRVDLVAGAANSQNETISTLNQQVRQYSAGIQVSIPVYSGGGVDASVTQAVAEVSRTEAQLDADLQRLTVDIRRQFQTTQTGVAKVEALKDAVAASAIALEGNRRGFIAGQTTMVDVLDATRRLFLARRDFVQARYEVLLARLRLQAFAGLPVADIVQDIDRHLTAPLTGAKVASVAQR